MHDICVACGSTAKPNSQLCDDCLEKATIAESVRPNPNENTITYLDLKEQLAKIKEYFSKRYFYRKQVLFYQEHYWNIIQSSISSNGYVDYHIRNIETFEETIISNPTPDMFKYIMIAEVPKDLL